MTVREFLRYMKPIGNQYPRVQLRINNRIEMTTRSKTRITEEYGRNIVRRWFIPETDEYGDIVVDATAIQVREKNK